MRKGLFLAVVFAALLATAGDALACHRGKSHSSASSGGCASCGGSQLGAAPSSGGCSSGRCAWVQLDSDQYAWVDGAPVVASVVSMTPHIS